MLEVAFDVKRVDGNQSKVKNYVNNRPAVEVVLHDPSVLKVLSVFMTVVVVSLQVMEKNLIELYCALKVNFNSL